MIPLGFTGIGTSWTNTIGPKRTLDVINDAEELIPQFRITKTSNFNPIGGAYADFEVSALGHLHVLPRNGIARNFAVGYLPGAGTPTERLDVDGTARLRDMSPSSGNVLITGVEEDGTGDYSLNYLGFSGNQDEYLAGDGTWQPYDGSPAECDWQLVTNPAVPSDFDVVTGFVEPGCYPGGNVGVGTATPEAKLEVINNIPTYDSNPNPNTAWGIHSFMTNYHIYEPVAIYGEADGAFASIQNNTGGKFEARNGIGNTGVYGVAINPTETSLVNSNTGVKALATDAVTNLGVYSNANGGGDGRAWGVYAIGENSSHNVGGLFRSYGGGQSACFGVVGIAEHVSNVNEIGVYGEGSTALYLAGTQTIGGPIYFGSDEMFKSNISDDLPGLEIINQLNPKSYYFNTEEFSYMNFPSELQYGLIAQELEQVLPNLVKHVSKPEIVDPISEEIVSPALDHLAVNYTELIPILIKATQEQQVLIDQQQTQINDLMDVVSACCAADNRSGQEEDFNIFMDVTETALGQNYPNPFQRLTTISYTVGCACEAQIVIMDQSGRIIETFNNGSTEAGTYTQEWDASDLASGIYFYALMVDGQEFVKRAVKL